MPDYFVGPFSRMLPAIDDPPSDEQESRSSREPMDSIYQIPPPRAPIALRFGSDPFLRQHAPTEGPNSGRGRRWDDTGPRKEQLPSVSQLLTPVSLSSASSPYDRRPGRDTQAAYSVHHNDKSLVSSAPSAPIFERSTYQQPRSLPPIVNTPVRNRENELWSLPETYGTLPDQPLHHDRLPHLDATPPNKEPASDLRPSTAFTENHPQAPLVQPHVVDERYIEGEGLCYVYADSSYCPKNIDGVPVNANWGITKAGKPRKRLAQACLTCREKKIKCHPNLPKCDQCQKSGRECRFENAPRGNRAASKASHLASSSDALSHGSPGASSFIGTAYALERSTSLPLTVAHTPESDTTMGTLSVWDHAQRSDGEFERAHSSKKRRLSRGSAGQDESSKRSLFGSMEPQRQSDYAEILFAMRDLDPDDPLAHEWSTDPYEVEPESTTHHLENYFTYVNDNLYPIFPRKRFLLWVRSCQTKSLDDKMLLYWMLAMGCIFSDRSDKVAALKKYSRTARYAVERIQNTLTLQLAQSRIIMSLWYYAIGAMLKSWDYVGAAIRTVSGLNYNFESLGVIVDQNQGCEYGLHPQALIECRRRTFWVAYLMDRFSSFNSPFIPSQAAFLRLPCREETYEAQQYTTVPYFQNKAPSSADDISVLSPLAFLIDILSLWGDVSDQGFKLSMTPAESYNDILEAFYASIIERCDEWSRKLPDELAITTDNIERSVRTKKVNMLLLNHLIYHDTLLKLNRYVRYEDLRAVTVDRFICRARYHAVEILQICLMFSQHISGHGYLGPGVESESFQTMVFNPFMGYMVLSAADVLSAAGAMTGLFDSTNLIRGGLDMLRGINRHWQGMSPLVSLIEKRLNAMIESLNSRSDKLGFVMDSTSLEAAARSPTPIARQCSLKTQQLNKQDLLYGDLPRERLLIALGIDASLSKDNILWIRENSHQ